MHGVIGDFERHLDRVPSAVGPRIVAFLGGTIGNFPPGSRRRLLREIGSLLGPDDHLLMGTDLVKDPEVLEAAYDDAQGVTAEFNRNVLRVLNRELDADFDPEDFDHIALFDPEHEWIEMRLRARREHTTLVRALDLPVHFRAGEEMRTEISAKFTPERLEGDLAAAGLELVRWLTDPEELFALTLSQAQLGHRLSDRADRGFFGNRRSAGPPGSARRPFAACTQQGAIVTVADINAEKGAALASELGVEFVKLRRARGGPGQGRRPSRPPRPMAGCASRCAAPGPAGRRRWRARRAPTR